MQIPEIGQRILFVAAAAINDRPAQIRPGQVIELIEMTPTNCRVNAIIKLNGPSDHTQPAFQEGEIMAFDCFLKNIPFSSQEKQMVQGTWHLPKYMIYECHAVTVKYDIIHGRERIRRGAVGIVNELNDTIMFHEEDVQGMGSGMSATYEARRFMDQHAARLQLESNKIWNLGTAPVSAEESPGEREGLVKDLRHQQGDRRYRYMRQFSGLTNKHEAESIRLAREAAENADQQALPDERGERGGSPSDIKTTDTKDDSKFGRPQRLDLDGEHRRSRELETAGQR